MLPRRGGPSITGSATAVIVNEYACDAAFRPTRLLIVTGTAVLNVPSRNE